MSEDAKPVRAGEEIDAEKLRGFLGGRLGNQQSISISQFPGGSSNLTYCVTVGDQEFVLRRPPFGNRVKSAHDMGREFEVLSKLSAIYPAAPKPLVFCDDEDIIGSKFFLMERRRGLIIRGQAPAELENSPELRQKVVRSFVDNLAALHALDYAAAGLEEFGRPEGYARRQVEGWTKRYANARTHDHSALESIVEWLAANIPLKGGAALIHNDYKFDNVMLDPRDLTRITAVLDWEMSTVGDPLMDLGSSLAYWMDAAAGESMLSMPFNPRCLMENISRREIVEMYESASGRASGDMLFYYVFGIFKLAVIAQQIFYRFKMGFTRDARFARFDVFVGRLGEIGAAAIDRGAI
jgi:aminoglycoside phosphotransferase (APT) family kinase protein